MQEKHNQFTVLDDDQIHDITTKDDYQCISIIS